MRLPFGSGGRGTWLEHPRAAASAGGRVAGTTMLFIPSELGGMLRRSGNVGVVIEEQHEEYLAEIRRSQQGWSATRLESRP